MDIHEHALFLFLCGRVKTELSENADVTVSIYNPSEHALRSLGITRGYFVYLFSDFKLHIVFVWTGNILKTLLAWTQIFLIRIKRFSKNLDTCGWSLKPLCDKLKSLHDTLKPLHDTLQHHHETGTKRKATTKSMTDFVQRLTDPSPVQCASHAAVGAQ